MSTLRQPTEKVNNPRLPLTDFVYLIPKNQFVYLPTGYPWVKGGVDGVLGRVDGMKATEWLKINRAVMVLPEKERP